MFKNLLRKIKQRKRIRKERKITKCLEQSGYIEDNIFLHRIKFNVDYTLRK